MSGDTFADLTGGFGIDCSYISRNFKRGYYIERGEELCTIATHNFSLLGLQNVTIVNGDSIRQLAGLPHCDWIFVDPARRDGAGKRWLLLLTVSPML